VKGAGLLRSRLSGLAIDLSPLRDSRDFRLLMASGLITYMGSMITYVALPFQIKELTGSYIAVGLIGAIELIPLIIFGLYGGALADFVDRKILVVSTEAILALLGLILLFNALLPEPRLWVIYLVAGLFAAVDGLQRPSLNALIPRIVRHEQLPAAAAISSLRWQIGMIIGPAAGGLIIAGVGLSTAYAIDICSFLVSLVLLSRMRRVPAREGAERPSIQGMVEGVQYALKRQDLVGTYVVDLVAMFFAIPVALFPFWADRLDAPWALGLLYSAGTVGSLLATISSGWVGNYHRHGKAIVIAASAWGAAIAVAGLFDNLFVVLIALAAAGAADMISGLFRSAIWNQTIPDEYRGRLAGIEMLSYSVGPMGGQMRAGFMASWFGLRPAIIGGGVLCILGVGAVASRMPKFRAYDALTDEYAVKERELRSKNRTSGTS
jgi:MFS family permease